MQLGRYQSVTFNGWTGTTGDNHIGAIFQAAPQKASNAVIELLATRRGKYLENYLATLPKKVFETDDAITWDVIGGSRRNIPVVEARNESGVKTTTGNLGVNGLPFYAVFPEPYFADGNVIEGELNELYPIRVLGEPVIEGSNYVYKVELMGGIMSGIPASEFEQGKRFSVSHSPVESEWSRKVGDIHFSTPLSLRNEFSTIRIYHEVAGKMLDKKLAFGLPIIDEKGQRATFNTWMHYVDYQYELEFSTEKNQALVWGRSNKNANGEYTNIGKSGKAIKCGAGIEEQRQVGGTIYYNIFSLKLIEEALYSIATNKLPMNDRVFILRTGERGAAQFSKAVLNTVSGWTAFSTINGDQLNMVSKVSSPLHTNALSAGFQFVEFRAPNGLVIKVEVDPAYDDDVRHKIKHPNGGVAFSYRYDLDYIGGKEEPNIQLATVKGLEEVHGMQWGFMNPFTGQVNNNNMSWDIDGAAYHKKATLGAIVFDSTKCLSIIPSLLR